MEYDRISVVLKPGYREKIAEMAKKNNRSMSSEIISILEEKFRRGQEYENNKAEKV